MVMNQKSKHGFTLIELVIVIVLLSILAIVAMVKYTDLVQETKIAATKATLAAVRSALAMKYAESATGGTATFPNSLSASDFGNNTLPTSKLNEKTGVGTVAATPGGTDTSASVGFWYIVSSGTAGAYSNGSVDTSSW